MFNYLQPMLPTIDKLCEVFGSSNVSIAGGYLRDLYLDGFPKDVDVFVTTYIVPRGNFLHKDLYEFFRGNKINYRYLGKSIYTNSSTFEVKFEDSIPMQIIFIDKAIKLQVHTYFDHSACMIYFNMGEQRLRILPEFENSLKDGFITLFGANIIRDIPKSLHESRINKSKERAMNCVMKYPFKFKGIRYV